MAAPPVYLDDCVDQRVVAPLARRGFIIITPQSQNTVGLPDEQHLAFAALNSWVMLSHNTKHFRKWHRVFQQQGLHHSGIITLPHSPLQRLELRIAMMLDWIAAGEPIMSRHLRWTDLQQQLIHGFHLLGYTAAEVQLVCGRTSP